MDLTAIVNPILNILSLGIKPIYEKHLEFSRIVLEFRNKLPRKQNTAKHLTNKEKDASPLFSSLAHFTVIDLSSQKTSIAEADIDLFYNKLDNFDLRFMFFKEYYRKYIRNLYRFNPKAEQGNFDLHMVQQVLKDDPMHPTKPVAVLVYHLKWKLKLTSKAYIWFLKRNR